MLGLTPRILKAIKLSSKLHNGYFKKVETDIPYSSHAYTVAWICNEYTDNEDTIIAALMHDTLEDVKGYGYDDLVKDFGKNIADIVLEHSDELDTKKKVKNENIPWRTRKQKNIDDVSKLSSKSLIICAADLMDNTHAKIYEYKKYGEDMWKSFHAGKEDQLWYHSELTKRIDKRMNNKMSKELVKLYTEFQKLVTQ